MVKVFLVEDEFIVRNGIKKSIAWEDEGMTFAGEAGDGELAFPLIKKTKPDILITDIKMPFMNGIELSEAVHKILPDTKIVILSGYGEFEYAQQAINIGIEKYLLKPISSAKLLEALRDVAQKIEKEKAASALKTQYLKEMEENTEHSRYKFFARLLAGNMPVSEILEEGEILGMDLSASCYNILFFKVKPIDGEQGYAEAVITAEDEIKQMANQQKALYYYQRGSEGFTFLFLGADEESILAHMRQFTEYLAAVVERTGQLMYFGSIGPFVSRLSELRQCYDRANRSFALRFFKSWNQILSGNEVDFPQISSGTDTRIENLESMNNCREVIEKFLKIGTEEEIKDFVSAYLDNMNQNNLKSLMFRQYIIMDFYISVGGFLNNLGVESSEESVEKDINVVIQKINTVEDTRIYMEEMLSNAISLRDRKAGRKYSDILQKATIYIGEHYMDEEISLNNVAWHVNISPSYFSTLFSKESGKTFVEYLTEIRMEKAKELLMCSSMKTTEIAYQVGYKDGHYFSYIFKKTQQCSPKEYRARRKEAD